ncbi:MAG: response regulator transcription factor [Rhodoferax sp.]|nr:response regulator transcription factor [Rhodoferax sp.]
MIRLFIADDHAIVRSGLKQIFAMAPDLCVIAEAASGSEVIDGLRIHEPDLLLLDMNMSGLSGPDLIARVRAQRPVLPILVLSMHNETQLATRALRAGANGYVTKDCEPEVLLAGIRKVASGGKFIAPEMAEKMAFDASSPTDGPRHTRLSDRELEVFRLLVTGLSVNEIAEKICISNKTVSTHKVRLMEKLQINSVAELVMYAVEHNLKG